ncbi:MAG: VWA domain-containing protein [Thermoguttaceae bacterium]
MSPTRRFPPTLDSQFVAALAATPMAHSPTRDRVKFHRPGRTRSICGAVTLSGILHLATFLALSAAALSIELGELSMISAEMSTVPEEAPLETFTAGLELLDESLHADVAAVLTECPDPLEQLPVSEQELVDPALKMLPEPSSPEFPIDDLWTEFATDGRSDGRRIDATGTQGDRAGQDDPGTAEYFGTVAEGDRFVYVLDVSSSMDGSSDPNGPSRFDRAVSELVRSLDRLRPTQSFYVVLFSDDVKRMFDETGDARMLEATPQNKRRLQKWLRSIHPRGGTDPHEAIRFAMRLKPSAVFMLSDGDFAGFSNNNADDVLGADSQVGELVGRDNRNPAPIHSFAYEDPQARKNMQALASLTGGRFRYIEPKPAGEQAPAGAKPKPAALPQQPPALAQQLRPSPRQQADAMLRGADELRDDGKLVVALENYRELIHQHPLTPAAATARGRIVQTLYAMRMDPRRGGGPR